MAYSQKKKTQAIVLLATTEYNFEEVSKKTGIPEITLRRWGNEQQAIDIEKNDRKKMPIPDMLEAAIQEMLRMIPREWSGQNWGIAVGILFDKWLLMQGESTNRTENIIRGVKDLSPDDRNSILSEAERIIAESSGGGDTHS